MPAHAMTPLPLSPVRLNAYPFALRNLQLLSAMEDTRDMLAADTDVIRSIERTYDEIYAMLVANAQHLSAETVQAYLPLIETGADKVSRKWRNAHSQSRLHAQGGVGQAWQRYMDALYSLHEKMEEVRNWLEDLQACMEPSMGREFTDVDEMFDYIMSSQ